MSRKFLTPIQLPADPALALEAATKQYVDAQSRWNNAWGVVAASAPGTTVTVPAGSGAVAVTNTLTITMVTGRRYRLTFQCRASSPAAGPIAQPFLLYDGATSIGGALDWWSYMPAPYAGFVATCLLNGDGATHNYTVRGSQNGGTSYTLYIDNPVSPFYIEDIGPVAGATPIPNPTPVWIAPTLVNSWRIYGSGFTDPGYRIVGDVVQLRGMMTGGAMTSTMFILPGGYRPTRAHIVPAVANDAFGQCRVQTDGSVMAQTGATGWFSIDNISFSVT